MPILAGMITSSGGRFIPPITVARTGLGLTAGQFKITDANYAQYNYVLTGSASRTGNIVTLPGAPSGAATSGTVQVMPPKGGVSGAVVNVARTPYTYHSGHHDTLYCATNWHSGQCAGWGTHHNPYGPVKNGAPANYTDSEGEWWRIW